ncbi:MAG: hypothetical protein C5S33_06565 [ANME-2 cluster archaeon]|jgi:ATP-dependent DNA helicase RecG|nr:hypothetical protein [ANME-2 cluster archaeon]
MKESKIPNLITKIKTTTPAHTLETQQLDFKRFPTTSSRENHKKKLSSLLREYAVAFANSDGGILLLGIENNITSPEAITGCHNYNIEEMRRMVFDGTRPPIIAEIEELPQPEGMLLAVKVSKSSRIHSTSSGKKYQRVGTENRLIFPEDEINLKVAKGYDYTAGYMLEVGLDSIDPLEVSRLRNWIEKYSPGSESLGLDDTDLLKSLGIIQEIEGEERLTIAGLMLVGKKQASKRHLPQNEIIYFRFGESDVDPVQSIYMKMPLLRSIEKVWDMIEPFNQIHTIKDAFLETPVPSFPEDVVREALLNAVVHRDYTLPDSVYVRMFPERLEISSPGSFIGGVTPYNVLTHPPVRRNPLLAEIFQHIGAVNRGGLGVDRMYRRLLSYGKLPPIYPDIDGAVEVILRNGTFDEAMAKFVGKKAREGHGWRLEELIILHHLRRHDEISAKEASTILQRTQKEASETLSLMEGVFLERVGTGRGTYYQLGHEILSSLGDKEKYTRIKGLSEEQKLQLLKNYIDTNGRITNEEARAICGINRHQATRLIQKLVHKEIIKQKGKGRGAHYEKC